MSFGAGAVQATGNSTGSGTAVSKAFGSNVAVGNLIVICGMKFSPGADDPYVAGDCTQTAGTATLGPISLDNTVSRSLGTDFLVTGQWSCVVTGAGSLTLQVGGALATSAINMGIAELHSDVATAFSVEATNTGTGASGNAVTGSSSSAGAAAFVGAVTVSSGVITVTEGAGYSLIFEQQDGSAFVVCSSEYQLVSGATTDTADWTLGTNTGWVASLVIYKEVLASASTNVPQPPTPRLIQTDRVLVTGGGAPQAFAPRKVHVYPSPGSFDFPVQNVPPLGQATPDVMRLRPFRAAPFLARVVPAVATQTVTFDPALMAAMSGLGPTIVISQPQVVASGMTPPDNVPN